MQRDAMFLDENKWCFRDINFFPKLKFDTVPVKIVEGFVTKLDKLTLKFYTKVHQNQQLSSRNRDKFSKLARPKCGWMNWALCMKKKKPCFLYHTTQQICSIEL